LIADHGAAVYLNGTPVAYYHLATNAAYNAFASPAQSPNLEDTWTTFSIDPGLLANGINTLAVEVHQGSSTSSDLSFDLQLLAASQGTAYEPFNYGAGTPLVLVTNSGGQWWTAAGTGGSNAMVVNDSLVMPGLSPPSGGAMQSGAVGGPSARFNLISNVTSGTLYYSFSFKVTSLGALSSSGGSIAGFNNSRGSQTNTPHVFGTRILARAANGGGFNLGVAKDTTTAAEWVWATYVFSPNQTIFLVGSYTFNPNSSTDDVSQLWLNPGAADFGSSLAPVPTLTATSGADITGNQIASFVFFQGGLNNANQPGAATVDELRIGTTWASVTPRAPLPPSLSVRRAGGKIVLSWPLTAGDFVLETAGAPGPTSGWTSVSQPAAIVGDQFKATNGIGTGTGFFRLRAP
jgi:hypothetical protein